MKLDAVTPLILTYNEEANLERTLDRLRWAKRIIVVDSFSTDRTLQIAGAYPQVKVVQRTFDTFAGQCNFGLKAVDTEWVLSLDADYLCTEALVKEIAALPAPPCQDGFAAPFRYCIQGKPLRGTLYPPRTILYRKSRARYRQDGHAHRVEIAGEVGRLRSYVDHDDRKPLRSWLLAQDRYTADEVAKLWDAAPEDLGVRDRLRSWGWVVPLLIPLYCLFGKGLILDGRAGWFYTLQRTYAEVLLALKLLDHTFGVEIRSGHGYSRSDPPSTSMSEAVQRGRS